MEQQKFNWQQNLSKIISAFEDGFSGSNDYICGVNDATYSLLAKLIEDKDDLFIRAVINARDKHIESEFLNS